MLNIFGFSLHLYGLLIGLGIYLCASLLQWILDKDQSFDKDIVWSALPYVVILGIFGARIYHVIHLWDYYQNNFWEIFKLWRGGIGIYGALIGGFLGLILFAKMSKLKSIQFFRILDGVCLVIPLGQAVGRFGNYFNQELYGRPLNAPWAVTIDLEKRLPGYENISTYHPLFFYESFLNLILFGILFYRYKKNLNQLGSLVFTGLYLIGYGVIRLVLEFFRINPWQIGHLPTAQIISTLLILMGIFLILKNHHFKKLFIKILPVFLLIFLSGCQKPIEKPEASEDIPSHLASQVTPLAEREYLEIQIADKPLNVELITTAQKSALGLSYRKEIGADGMLFVLPQKSIPTFWMKGMYMDLDMIWIDCEPTEAQNESISKIQDTNSNQNSTFNIGDSVEIYSNKCIISDITKNVPAPENPLDTSNLPTYSPRVPVTHVLEVEKRF